MLIPAIRLLATVLLWACAGLPCRAQTLHAVIVGDTSRPELTTGADASTRVVRALVRDVARYTDLSLALTVIDGEAVSAQRVQSAINALNVVAGRDVVLFYFVGHGVLSRNRANSTGGPADVGNALPRLWVGNDFETGLDGSAVLSGIRAKSPRLTVVIVEACNRATSPYATGPSGLVAAFASPQERYRALFLQASGELVAMAAEPGETAFLERGAGGFFTNAFVGALREGQSWQDVVNKLRQPIKVVPAAGTRAEINQQPRVEWRPATFALPKPEIAPPPSPRPGPTMVRVGNGIFAARDLVTVAQFRAFVDATSRQVDGPCRVEHLDWRPSYDFSWRSPGYPQSDRHPVVCVSYTDATAYAAWLSDQTGSRYRLMPLDWWVTFARQADPVQHSVCRGCRLTAPSVQPVGSAGPDAWGLNDVLGNVWQWVDACDGARCKVRGGAWVDGPDVLRTREFARNSTERWNALGFRVVRIGE
jgi:hypothetical protein